MTITIPSINDIDSAAAALADEIRRSGAKIVAFDGCMGAGKTTLIRSLVRCMGANAEEANSPSFSILNVYETPAEPIYHFDLYRLNDAMEAFDIGFCDYLDSGCLCLLEWPERVEQLLPEEETARVVIDVADDDVHTRTVTFIPASR